MRSLPPMSRLRHMLPCLEAVEGGRGRLGHRSTFSTCQCARSIGASTGVDPQKERRASAANWFWQAMISVARPPPATETTPAWWNGHANFFEEIEVTIALAMALWSIATGPRATRAGSSRTGPGSLRALRRAPGLVDGAPASGRRQTPGCAVHREKAVQRSLKVSAASPSTCGLLVPGRINGDLDITV